MNKDLTEIIFILDRSGSMGGLEADTIGGFNALLDRQKSTPGEAILSTVLFDHETQVLHDRVPLDQVEHITARDYFVRGCTALLDAVGGAIHHIGTVHRYARPEDVPERTLVVITTDGLENASRLYTLPQVQEMVRRQQEEYGWEFLFLGANIDAVETAGQLGISPQHSANYCPDQAGIRLNYEVLSDEMCFFRRGTPLRSSWKKRIVQDFKKRR